MATVVRQRLEAATATLCAVAATMTAIWPQWLEALGFDPDAGNGTTEWALVGCLGLVSLLSLGALARDLRPSRAS